MFEAIASFFRMCNKAILGTENLLDGYVEATSIAKIKATAYANKERTKLLAEVIADEPKQLT